MNQQDHIELVEYEKKLIHISALTEEEAQYLYNNFGNKIFIEWPSPKTRKAWQLQSQGWVGYIPLSPDKGISIKPKVPLENLFGMLEYAYDLESFEILKGIFNSDSIYDFYECLAVILSDMVLKRTQQGLYRTYIEEKQSLSYIKGKIDINELNKNPLRTDLTCICEDLTVDIIDNQIIAWTLYCIIRSGLIKREKAFLKVLKAERVFRNSVSIKNICSQACIDRTYNRINQDYSKIHRICQFFLENMGPSYNSGTYSMIPFLINMNKLFELFISQWMKKKFAENKDYDIKVQHTLNVGGKDILDMRMDILIIQKSTLKPVCVVDTKYKNNGKVSNNDYNQIVAYADAINCKNGLLLYPCEQTGEFDVQPGKIRVRTTCFDLSRDIKKEANERFIKILMSLKNESISLSE